MKKIYLIFTIALTLALTSCFSTDESNGGGETGRAPIVNSPEGAENGEILIKFRPEISGLLDQSQTRSGYNGVMTRSGISTVDQLMEVIGGYELERVFPQDTRSEERTRKSGLHLWYTVRFDKNMDVQDVARQLSQLGELSKIEYSRKLKRSFTGTPRALKAEHYRHVATRAGAFNDPQLNLQWHYINDGDESFMQHMVAGADVNCKDAWAISTGDPSIIVAVMDEGVMWSHEDLADNIWINEKEVYKSFEDNDGNGYKGDVYGYNFVDDTGVITWDAITDTGHGTHVAGTIAAVNNNGIGVGGIAGGNGTPNSGVKIMSLQIFAGDYGVNTQNEVRAIKYAADNGAVILQCSWGYMSALANSVDFPKGGFRDDEEYAEKMPLEKEAFDYFVYNAGSPNGVIDGGVVIFASGNEFAAMSAYPGAYKDLVSVSAMAADFTPSSYTNYGPGVDLTAPGGDTDYHQSDLGGILSTLPSQHGDYGYMDGTSMACPHVSGVAALGLSHAVKLRKHFNSREFRDLLISSVNKEEFYSHYYTEKFYYHNWGSAGETSATLMDLNRNYRGKMGSGAIDAGLFLKNIENNGVTITLPNVYVAAGSKQTVDLKLCFSDSANSTFTAASGNTSIATVEVNGKTVIVTGIAVGSTTFTVTSSKGEKQTTHITVRKTANGNGWL